MPHYVRAARMGLRMVLVIALVWYRTHVPRICASMLIVFHELPFMSFVTMKFCFHASCCFGRLCLVHKLLVCVFVLMMEPEKHAGLTVQAFSLNHMNNASLHGEERDE